jgi:hypothetical protein
MKFLVSNLTPMWESNVQHRTFHCEVGSFSALYKRRCQSQLSIADLGSEIRYYVWECKHQQESDWLRISTSIFKNTTGHAYRLTFKGIYRTEKKNTFHKRTVQTWKCGLHAPSEFILAAHQNRD